MSNMLRTMTIRFANKIDTREIPYFRGAIIKSVGDPSSVLFHNHVGSGYLYRYPQIQYKRIGGKAAIVCVGEGVDEIGGLFDAERLDVLIGRRRVGLDVDDVVFEVTPVQVWDNWFEYSVEGWFALNQHNYHLWTEAASEEDKIDMMEKILVGNILSMCKSLEIWLADGVACKITQMVEMRDVEFKDMRVSCFNIIFRSNVLLPNNIGLGRKVGMGFGTLRLIDIYK